MQTPVIEIRENEYLIKLNRSEFDLSYLRKVLKNIGLEQADHRAEYHECAGVDDELSQYYDHLSDK